MTLANRLFRLFSTASAYRTASPRLDALSLSSHDLADLNLPPSYRTQLDIDRSLRIAGRNL